MSGWFVAQLIKLITGIVVKKGKLTFAEAVHYFTKSGGMPSGHTASLVALSTAIALFYGLNNPVFALAVCTTALFIYDAVNVRYAVGEHGKLLNEIARSDNNPKTTVIYLLHYLKKLHLSKTEFHCYGCLILCRLTAANSCSYCHRRRY